MDRILVLAPHEDRAGRASSLAGSLAERHGSRVTLLRVLEDGAAEGPQTSDERQVRELLVESETRELERLAAPLRERGVDVSVEVTWGVAWEATSALARRDGYDLVVKPARGLGHEGRVFFGSTALHLFRRCPCPVWVVGDDGRLPERILTAIDPAADASRRAVASRLLGWAQRVAELSGAEVHVAAAWHAPGAELLKDAIPPSQLEGYVGDALSRARESLGLILAEGALRVSPERVHLVEGHAREALPRFVEEQGFDLIVMGTLGRSDLVGELMGETAETIVRSVRSSVLAVAPPREV